MINLSFILDGVIKQIKDATGLDTLEVKVDVKNEVVLLNGKEVNNTNFVKNMSKIGSLVQVKIGQKDYDYIVINTDEQGNTQMQIMYTKDGIKCKTTL